MIVGTIVIILAALITYQTYRATIEDPLQSAIAQCLTENGVIMYGLDTCPACAQQKRVFGTSFKHITYIEGSRSPNEYREAAVAFDAIPAWRFGDEFTTGVMGIGELAERGGCAHLLEQELV